MCIVDTVLGGQSIRSQQVDFATRGRRRWAAGPALLVLLAFTGILLVAPSPAGATSTSVISYAGRDGHVYRYDVATGQRRSMNLTSSAEVYWSPDGHQLETKMLLDTKTELARLYQLTAGFSGYVRSQVAQ